MCESDARHGVRSRSLSKGSAAPLCCREVAAGADAEHVCRTVGATCTNKEGYSQRQSTSYMSGKVRRRRWHYVIDSSHANSTAGHYGIRATATTVDTVAALCVH